MVGIFFLLSLTQKTLLRRFFLFSSSKKKKKSEEIKIKKIFLKLGNLCAWNIHEMQIFHPPLHAIYFSLKIVRIYLHLPDRKEFLPFWWSSLSHSPKMVQNDRVPFLILEFCEIASKIFLFLHSKLNFASQLHFSMKWSRCLCSFVLTWCCR